MTANADISIEPAYDVDRLLIDILGIGELAVRILRLRSSHRSRSAFGTPRLVSWSPAARITRTSNR